MLLLRLFLLFLLTSLCTGQLQLYFSGSSQVFIWEVCARTDLICPNQQLMHRRAGESDRVLEVAGIRAWGRLAGKLYADVHLAALGTCAASCFGL